MKKNNIIILLIAIIIIAIVILIFKISFKSKKNYENSINYENNTNVISSTINTPIKNNQIQNEPKTIYIKNQMIKSNSIQGIVKNNSGKDIKNIRITADCYDESGNKITTVNSYLENLKNGETWRFDMWISNKVKSYKNLRVEY